MTSNGIVPATTTTQVARNIAANFQSCMETCSVSLRKNLLPWIYDFFIHAENEGKILQVLEKFLRICEEKIIFVSAKQSIFLSKSIERCGLIVGKDGVRMNPYSYSGMKSAHEPKIMSNSRSTCTAETG